MKTFETLEPIDLNVAIPLGSIHVIASPRNDTSVAIDPTDPTRPLDVEAAEKTEVAFTGGNLLSIKTPHPRGIMGAVLGRYGSVEVTIELPMGSSLDASTGLGDIRVDGPTAETRLKTGAGDAQADGTGNAELTSSLGALALRSAKGEAKLTTSGDLRVGVVEGNATIKNTNGRTSIDDVTGHLRVRGSNGDIEIGRSRSSVDARTANGSIDIGEVSAGSISAQTATGSVSIGVRQGTAAWVDARTKFGRINNTIPSADLRRTSA